jgi:predicted lipoprotein with Yx(FWY)xxD motif
VDRKLSPAPVAVAILILVVAAATACGGGGSTAASPSVKAAFNKKLDESILVESHGLTLYLFNQDSQTANTYKPTCYDDAVDHCAKVWPPLRTTGTPTAGPGAKAALLGTAKRTDGADQVTYNGHPLYTNAGLEAAGIHLPADKKPGDANGQGFYSIWYVLSPDGKQISR